MNEAIASIATTNLAKLLLAIPSPERLEQLQAAISFLPSERLETEYHVGRLRAEFATAWETVHLEPVPVRQLRELMKPPIAVGTILMFLSVNHLVDLDDATPYLAELLGYLKLKVQSQEREYQQWLFDDRPTRSQSEDANIQPVASSVGSLDELVQRGVKFPSIYADPPWRYDNRASRAAAENHYPTMSLEEICAEPVKQLAADKAHLHLWTTNGFLREAFEVIDAWGFTYKSCLVWIKDEIGMGNYWRVSHEYLLLGVRGGLTFRSRKEPSWIQSSRTIHSRKPGVVRKLIERVSPAPYLELYGREELPNSLWTVYGNRVEPRLF